MIDLHQIVSKQIKDLKHHISEVKHERDNSASSSESWSDKTRDVTDQLFHSLQDKLANLNALLASLNKLPSFNNTAQINTIANLTTPTGQQKFLLVPEGLGGQKIGDITLLSTNSPLAQQFLGQATNFKFSFNNQNYQVNSLNPNS